jgi:hypothetical protein
VNPIFELTPDQRDPKPLIELKQQLVIFVRDPPGPNAARKVYNTYIRYCGDIFKVFKSTFPFAILRKWGPEARSHFENKVLPDLRKFADWGYGFSDNKPTDSWLFMFHGFRPFRESDCASFYRFEFDWQVDSEFLRRFTEDLLGQIPFLSAYAGYFLQWRPSTQYNRLSLDRSFAYAMRHWGCEMVNVEFTAKEMNHGYKCVSWLTAIGQHLSLQFPEAMEQAKSVAYVHFTTPNGTVLQASEKPLLGDRNRLVELDGYVSIAKALKPMQIRTHSAFGGDKWTQDATLAWLRRFTNSE